MGKALCCQDRLCAALLCDTLLCDDSLCDDSMLQSVVEFGSTVNHDRRPASRFDDGNQFGTIHHLDSSKERAALEQWLPPDKDFPAAGRVGSLDSGQTISLHRGLASL